MEYVMLPISLGTSDWTVKIVDASSYLILTLAVIGVAQWLYLAQTENWYRRSLQKSVFYTLAIVLSLSVLNVIADWNARVQIDHVELSSRSKRKTIDLNLTLKGNRYSSTELRELAGQHEHADSALRGYELLSNITHCQNITEANVDDVMCFLRSVDARYRHVTKKEAITMMRNTLHACAQALHGGMDHPDISSALEPSLDSLFASAPDDVILVLQVEDESQEDEAK